MMRAEIGLTEAGDSKGATERIEGVFLTKDEVMGIIGIIERLAEDGATGKDAAMIYRLKESIGGICR